MGKFDEKYNEIMNEKSEYTENEQKYVIHYTSGKKQKVQRPPTDMKEYFEKNIRKIEYVEDENGSVVFGKISTK